MRLIDKREDVPEPQALCDMSLRDTQGQCYMSVKGDVWMLSILSSVPDRYLVCLTDEYGESGTLWPADRVTVEGRRIEAELVLGGVE